MNNVWNTDQVKLIFKSVLHRLNTQPDKLFIAREGGDVRISNDMNEKHRVYISLGESTKSVYISLAEQKGMYTIGWFTDREVKRLFNELIALSKPVVQVTTETLLECFPEAIDIQAEDALLIDKVPKK